MLMFLDLVFISTATVIAFAVFICKRYSGLAILAMTAAALAAGMAAPRLGTLLVDKGVTVSGVSLEALLGVGMIVLAFIIALVAGGKQKAPNRQIIGAAVAGIIGATMIAQFLPAIFREDLFAVARVDDLVAQWRNWIIPLGVGFGLVDLLLMRPGGGEGKHHPKK